MRVLFISHCSTLGGGAESSLLELIDELSKKDLEIYVAFPSAKGRFVDEIKKRGIRYFISKYYFWVYTKGKYRRWKHFERTLKTILSPFSLAYICWINKIDIIHTNTSVIPIGAYVNRITKIPHVWAIREFGEEDHGFIFCKGLHKATKIMNDYSTKVFVHCRALFNKYEKYVDKNKLIMIHNGISKKYINRKDFRLKDNISILMAGMITPSKGQAEAIMSVSELIRRGHGNVTLYIAGGGNKNYIDELKKIVEEHKIQKNVEFLGFVKDLSRIRQEADIALVCSRCEAFSRVAMESMFSMMPVIGTNSGGTPEIIQDGKTGFLYEPGNHRDLADKIEYFINNRAKLKEFGEGGFEYATNHFTSERNANEIYGLYKSIYKGLKE